VRRRCAPARCASAAGVEFGHGGEWWSGKAWRSNERGARDSRSRQNEPGCPARRSRNRFALKGIRDRPEFGDGSALRFEPCLSPKFPNGSHRLPRPRPPEIAAIRARSLERLREFSCPLRQLHPSGSIGMPPPQARIAAISRGLDAGVGDDRWGIRDRHGSTAADRASPENSGHVPESLQASGCGFLRAGQPASFWRLPRNRRAHARAAPRLPRPPSPHRWPNSTTSRRCAGGRAARASHDGKGRGEVTARSGQGCQVFVHRGVTSARMPTAYPQFLLDRTEAPAQPNLKKGTEDARRCCTRILWR